MTVVVRSAGLKSSLDTLREKIRKAIKRFENSAKTPGRRFDPGRGFVRSKGILVLSSEEAEENQQDRYTSVASRICEPLIEQIVAFAAELASHNVAFAELTDRAYSVERQCNDGPFLESRNALVRIFVDDLVTCQGCGRMTDAVGNKPFPLARGYFKRLETVEQESAATTEWMKLIGTRDFKERLRAGSHYASGLTQGPELAAGEEYVEQCRHVIQFGDGKFLDGCRDIFDLYRARSPMNAWLSPTERTDIETQISQFLSTERLLKIEAAALALSEICYVEDPQLRFSQLKTFAQDTLKGMQQSTLLLLIERSGRCPVADLATEVGTNAETPWTWWNDAKRVINRKLSKARLPWVLGTHNANALIEALPSPEK